jgi:hypothetical protein
MNTVTERADVRYELVGNQTVTVTADGEDYRAEPQTVTAQLLNLSTSGAKLSLPLDLPRDRSMRIKLTLEEFGLTIYVSGVVCWSAKSDGAEQSCIVGCRLNPNIPVSILEHVAQTGRLDRRDEDRRPTKFGVEVVRRRTLRSITEPADLRNYASGGVCLATAQPAELGERFGVRLGASGVKVDVIVRWTMNQGDVFLAGCEYVDPKSYDAIKSVLDG